MHSEMHFSNLAVLSLLFKIAHDTARQVYLFIYTLHQLSAITALNWGHEIKSGIRSTFNPVKLNSGLCNLWICLTVIKKLPYKRDCIYVNHSVKEKTFKVRAILIWLNIYHLKQWFTYLLCTLTCRELSG